jgi:GTP 3',8-cyclase
LSFDEIIRLAKAACSLGVRKIRLTGGEPLLRRGVVDLVARLRQETPIQDLALTTNGLLLPRLADALKSAGLHRVNLSLDALSPEVFLAMSGGYGSVQQVIAAAHRCLELGLPLKLNAVVKRGVNEGEVVGLLEFTRKLGVPMRFIEYMDVGGSNDWRRDQVVSEQEILSQVRAHLGPTRSQPEDPFSVARHYQLERDDYEFGVIASITRPFCGGCVRARLSSDGKLFTCLFSNTGHDLRSLLRSGAPDEVLHDRFAGIWGKREDRYSELRAAQGDAQPKVEMSYIGG